MTAARSAAHPLPIVLDDPRPAPTAARCLQCQLVGRRRLLCSRADECASLPHVFPVGPLLLAAWFVTAAGFVYALW